MQIDFDPQKDATNLSKHGVSLALAAELDWDAALVWVDDRIDYGEVRMIALAPKSAILFFVAFVDRPRVRKIISLHKANRLKARHDVKTTEANPHPDPYA